MGLKLSVWRWIHRHRRQPLVARLARLCKNIHRASEHPGYDVMRNGERDALARTMPTAAPVLFDVGANVGDWSAMALGVCPTAIIHAFEINPPTAALLAARYSTDCRVTVHPFGLAASSGSAELFAYAGEASVLSSLRVALHSHVQASRNSVAVRTGDDVCHELRVEKIDFLKIDAEGADFEVLSGFNEMLTAGRIACLQFEHEGGRYLRDFHDFLTPKGYVIGKLYANYVDFRPHSAELEHFLGPNYIAVPVSRDRLITDLRNGW